MPGAEIVYPPEDIQKLIDKTAEFVASNGSAVEHKIWESQGDNPKFSFLKPDDPYRAYYESKVFEFAEKLENEEEEELEEETPPESSSYQNPFYIKHPIIASVDMDIIKLTAQFVARNGKNFLMGLSEKESKNPQFDFLKPNHPLFSYFTNLVEAYSKCLLPKLEDVKFLQQNVTEREKVLQRCLDRFQQQRTSVKNEKTKEEIEEEERQQTAMIDWHDFVVVETIDFYENEELPPSSEKPLHTLDSGPFTSPPNFAHQESKKKLKASETQTQKCPMCGEVVPIESYPEHIRLELLDPRYKEQKQQISQNQSVYASDSEIYKNLKNLAKHRPDLSQSQEPPSVQPQLPSLVQQLQKQVPSFEVPSKRVPDVLSDYQPLPKKVKPLAPTYQASPVREKVNFRSNEELTTNLIPAQKWAKKNPGLAELHIKVPEEGGDDSWGFRGQVIQLSADLMQTVKSLKEKLSGILGGMPVQKMKFKTNLHSVLKDNETLASYNIASGNILELSVKERGGRRKL
mmetsp:Transcript_7150/g.10551  ORF Transcript_7150/g.10551 Transcript_7150/m.10551 type:complete len:515 (+) Transcript_7150:824-2368(+)|eukprot:CAMPEP_0202439474 /NCGR_PEP_ID=MMETSP1345-20130828/36180_1 /ASSEMBLY_ACC=CAM_ASM_000843 /TAXON_ID=342563 /ORGANISM="Fabrea Fabrea salina" /LENGTH=514 /DNA_ID=CAMNT_0049054009 /DNA_START=813 /DNA_END=2357 /DNA_ORIENTATION=-